MQLSKERQMACMQVHAPSICSSTLIRYFVRLSSAVTISEMPYFLRACIRPACSQTHQRDGLRTWQVPKASGVHLHVPPHLEGFRRVDTSLE